MKKRTFVLSTIFMLFFLVSCQNNETELVEILPDDIISMENLDSYMFRDDVQYVDLRNYEASFHSGFIYSFEQIPFFEYLDYRAFDRQDTYAFNPDQIINEEQLYRLFDKDKAIFLFADGCIRSGYLKLVLDYLGYERVYILGGFYEYEGIHKVLGDGSFALGSTFYSTYIDTDSKLTYYMYGIYDMDRKITSIRFDIVDEFNVSLRSPNYDLLIDYNSQLTILESFILSDFTDVTELFYNLTSTTENRFDEIDGYTLGYSDALISLIERLISN